MRATTTQPKVERLTILRPLYTKLQKCYDKGHYCTTKGLGRQATAELIKKENMLLAFISKHPSEDMCREYIANNTSAIAEVMRGNWATNVKSLKKLIAK